MKIELDTKSDEWPLASESVRDLRGYAGVVRSSGHFGASELIDLIADQIEAQTKPPRISEPGIGGIVRAGLVGLADRPAKLRVRLPQGWVNLEADGVHINSWDWSELVDPVLVREGV